MHYALEQVSRKNLNISSFPGRWACYSAFSVILDEKLCSRANGVEKAAIADRSVYAVADRCS